MSVEVICALITLGGLIFSAIISYAISRSTANKEIEKMQLTWNREDVVSSDDEFSAMARAVAKYIHSQTYRTQSDALEEVASVRSKESGTLGKMLDDLYSFVRGNDLPSVNSQLTKIIDQKRETKRKANTADRYTP